jgi:choice-of-anchor B domain-containing protein
MRNTTLPHGASLLLLLALALTAAAFTTKLPERGGPGLPMRAGFGRAVAVGNGEVLIGESQNTMRPGLVYIYRKNASRQWTEAARLTAPNASIGDGFGAALALDGNRLIVTATSGGPAAVVHVFERNAGGEWRHAAELKGPEGTTAFGYTVALSGDVALVGAPIDGGTPQGGPGAVYVFRRDASGAWPGAGKITARDATNETILGVRVATDGQNALVTSARGLVYAFRFDGSQWLETGTITVDGVQPNDGFGASLALSGDQAFIAAPGRMGGSGRVLMFKRDNATNAWIPAGQLAPADTTATEGFGSDIVTSNDMLLVGASQSHETGAAYLYRRTGSEWSLVTTLRSPDARPGDDFGGVVALNGNLAAIGLTNADFGAGKAAVFESPDGSTWTAAAMLIGEDESIDPVKGKETRCETGKAAIFPCGQVDLLSFLPISAIGGRRGVNLNDIWGWTDPQTGKEYALVGRVDGTSFVDLSDPVNPVYVGDLPMTDGARANAWRDIKVYKDHAFIVADGAGQHGMQVFDLAKLRQFSGTPITFAADTIYDRIASAHNIVINEESGFAYPVGSSMGGETCGGGLHMVDIREPKKPVFSGCFADALTGRAGTGYSHDAQCVTYKGPDQDYQGREICIGSNETAISIADVTDKKNPKSISRAPYPNVAYTHQGWFTEDQRYFLVNDEGDEVNGLVPRTRTLVWDVADLDDPQLVKEYLGETAATDHNLYIKGNLVFESNYSSGLRILDITNPLNPVEVGFLDVLPFGDNKPGYTGSWSNYPFFKSGVIAVTGIEQGLFLVRYRPTRPVS